MRFCSSKTMHKIVEEVLEIDEWERFVFKGKAAFTKYERDKVNKVVDVDNEEEGETDVDFCEKTYSQFLADYA